jgi:hypothetical protein
VANCGSIRLDADNPQEVANGTDCDVLSTSCKPFLEVAISGPGNANRLFVFSGIAIIGFERPDDAGPGTQVCEFDVILEKNLPTPDDFIAATTFASLTAIQFEGEEYNDWGCAVLQANTVVRNDGALRVIAMLEVLGGTALNRFAYQAHVLAHVE